VNRNPGKFKKEGMVTHTTRHVCPHRPVYKEDYSLMARPDPLLKRLLVLMLCCFVCEVVLLVQVKELFPEAGRKIEPLADSHTESTFFWIVHRIYKGLEREIALDCGTFSRAARSTDVDRVAVSVRSGYCETYLAPTVAK
jgi:hypothetical protein